MLILNMLGLPHNNVLYGILITRAWSSLPFLHKIENLLCDNPILIPASCVDSPQQHHHQFNWMAWLISTTVVPREAYLQKRLKPSPRVLRQALSTYKRCWRKFASWLAAKGNSSPISVPLVCNYLLFQFKKGCTSSTKNSIRSSFKFFLFFI